MASVRVNTQVRSGEDGGYVTSTFYGPRDINLKGIVEANDVATYEPRRRALAGIFLFEHDAFGRVLPKLIKCTTTDNLAVQFDAVLRAPLSMAIDQMTNTRWQAQITAPCFVLESQTLQTTLLTAALSSGGFILPVILPITFASSTGGTATVTNAGNGPAYPTITFTGPLTNPRLLNVTTNREVAFTYTIAAGSSVIVDVKAKTITEAGVNRYNKRTSTSKWWMLQPGNNSLFLNTSSSADTGTCKIEFRDSFIGV